MKIAQKGNTLRSTYKHRAFWIGLTIICGILAYTATMLLNWIFIGTLLAFFFLCFLWKDYRYLFDQIEMHDQFIRTRHAFKTMTIEWDEIASITKEKGMGVVFKLKNGSLQYGPDLGNATSTCNFLRARLKKRAM